MRVSYFSVLENKLLGVGDSDPSSPPRRPTAYSHVVVESFVQVGSVPSFFSPWPPSLLVDLVGVAATARWLPVLGPLLLLLRSIMQRSLSPTARGSLSPCPLDATLSRP